MPAEKSPTFHPIHCLDTLLYKFFKAQKSVAVVASERAEFCDGTTSADAFVLAREIEQWMFGTVEGRLWTTRRLNQSSKSL